MLSLGSGAFDGTTGGFFAGSSNGTLNAANAASGFTGDLLNYQIAGVSKFRVDATGTVYANSINGPLASSSAANAAGYTINSDSDSAGADGGVNIQVRGATKLAVTDNGRVAVGGATSPASALANTNTNSVDAAGTGSSTDSLTWLTNAAGYVQSLVNSSAATTANGLLVKTTGTAATNRILNLNSNGTDVMTVTGQGNVGIGTTGPNAKLDILGLATNIGADWSTGNARTDATTKGGVLTTSHYLNAQNPTNLIMGYNSISNNDVKIGGGTAAFNAATGIQFYTAANSTTVTGSERMRIDAAGNLGIGTTNPGFPLDVAGTIRASATNSILLLANTGLDGYMRMISSAGTNYIQSGLTSATSSAADLKFTDINGSNTWMTIKSTGNVGIGTTSPVENMQLGGDLASLTTNYQSFWGNISGANGITSGLRFYNRQANPSSTTPKRVAEIDSARDGNNYGGALYFNTSETSAGTLTERMRIDSSGNVGIGTTSPGSALDVASNNPFIISLRGGTSDHGYTAVYARSSAQTTRSAYYGFASAGSNAFAFGNELNNLGSFDFRTTSGGTNSSRLLIDNNGNVGIGTTNPTAKLEVTGQIVSKVFNNSASTTFDFSKGNSQYTSASCGAVTLQNMVDGGTYTVAIQGTVSGTCTFSNGGDTFLFSPANAATIGGSQTMFSFQKMGGTVYVSWIAGFQ